MNSVVHRISEGLRSGLDWSRGTLRRAYLASGAPELPRRARTLVGFAVGAALVVSIGGVAFSPVDDWLRFAIVVGMVVVSHLGRLRIRISGSNFATAWGDAAFIVAVWIGPDGWLPAALGLGVLLANLLLQAFADEWKPFVEIIRRSASLALAAGPAALVAHLLVRQGYDKMVTPDDGFALAATALGYSLLTVVITCVYTSLRDGHKFGALMRRALSSIWMMTLGNLAVGLGIVGLLGVDLRWLIALPPVLWLFQQAYTHRLLDSQERQGWNRYADAIRALRRHGDIAGIANAGARSALSLFRANEVVVELLNPDGPTMRYTAGGSPLRRNAGVIASVTRPLEVAGEPVGTLTLHFAGTVGLRSRDRAALAAYADALGVALHDAATHAALRHATERAVDEAVRDPLTKLFNREALLRRGDETLRGLDRSAAVALLMLDVDNFKEVNNTLGHVAGDQLLQIAAGRLGDLVSDVELLARLGGDEFGLLLFDLPEDGTEQALRQAERQALRRARRLAAALAEPTEIAGVTVSAETSVGVVVAAAGRVDMPELLRRADVALYQAKDGQSSVVAYDPSHDGASTDRLALVAEMRTALDLDDQLLVALQPAIDLSTGAPTGVEALARWEHPRRGRLHPKDFVRAVEASELLAPFTRYIVDKALTAAALWRAEGIDVPVSVNLSARNLLDSELPADIAVLLRKHRIPPARLVLEITETVVMSDLRVIDEVLSDLRQLGVQLSVDDFGTGYSSLTFLTRIAVDEVKVDRSFVRAMGDSPQAAAIVRTTVDLGRQLGLRVVAEGVETHEQRRVLTDLGCTAAQGFHFFRPMPSEEITAALRSLPEPPADAIAAVS
ncbi:bifunctional diguanylate cyclase/phosphodiesterase [Hamadaea sp. NPDC050747]|uniref:putative bifunctional diguanylate cyclase/phosphodiesterase n=1 Tax=Hamadaea sp. NPDC050747 TaxID=3155789 RepID=UPI0033EF1120